MKAEQHNISVMNIKKDKAVIIKSIFPENISGVLSKDPLSIKNSPEHINHKQIFRSVGEWFKTWTPWQKKVVLCGVTDRCSNTQLEYLSTALEPVFHRDFRNALTGNYPLSTSITKSLNLLPSCHSVSPDTVGRKKTMESFVYDYVKTIVANALSGVGKRCDETVRLRQSTLAQFNNSDHLPDIQYGSELQKNDETSLKMRDRCKLTSIIEGAQDERYQRPGVLRTRQFSRLPEIGHLKVANQNESGGCWTGGIRCSRQKATAVEKNCTKHFQKQVKTLWQWLNSWEDYQKSDLLVELLKQCDQSLLQFYTQCLLQRLRDRNDVNCLPDKLLLYIFSFLPASDINVAGMVCRRWHFITAQDDLWIIKCKEIGQKQAIPDLKKLVEESMESFLIDWREAYYELNTIVDNLKMTYYHSSEFKGLRLIDVLTPARITSPEDLSSLSSSSTSSSISSYFPDDRQRSTVVDLPIQQVEIFKKDSSAELSESDIPKKDNNDFNDYPCSSPTSPKLQSKSKLEIKEEEKKVVKKKRRKPKKAKEDNQNLALDIRPDHEQAKNILIAGQEGLKEEKMEGDKLTRHLNKVSMMVRSVKRVRRLQGHMNAVCCLKFDRKRIVTGSSDHSIRVWDIRSGRSIHKIYGHKGGVRCIEFNERWIISGSWDSTVMIWDVVKFTRIAVLIGHTDVVSTLQLIDLKYLVTGSHDKTICIWCLQDFKLIRTLTTHAKSVTCLAVDGENVISGSTDGLIKITRISDGKVINTFDDQTDPIATLAAQHNLILGGTTRGKVYFWDKLTGQVQAAVQLHETVIHKVAFLPFQDGDARFLTTSGDTSIKEWDLYTMTCVRALQGHKGAVRDVQVSEDRIVSCSDDGNVRIWDLMTPQFKPGDKADEDTIETRTINERQDKKHINN